MKKQIILLFYLFTILVCNAQNDTAKIYNSSVLKKGFYKNYDEYINNSPSVTPDFTTILLSIKNMTDTIITGAKYKINDGTTVSGSWGFCDGTDVFINKRISLFKRRYLKAQYIGKNPFFLSWHKDIYTIETSSDAHIIDTTPATKPARYDLMFINPEGKAKSASKKNLEKFFEADPGILKKFKTERAFTDKVKTEYLVEFNEKFINKSTERMQ